MKNTGTIKCRNCGTENDSDMVYCSECGNKIFAKTMGDVKSAPSANPPQIIRQKKSLFKQTWYVLYEDHMEGRALVDGYKSYARINILLSQIEKAEPRNRLVFIFNRGYIYIVEERNDYEAEILAREINDRTIICE